MKQHMKLTIPAIIAASVLFTAEASAEKAPCPARETGQAFPWQNLNSIAGDHEAVIYVDVDKAGRPLKCGLGKNDIPDPETRFRLCRSYMEDWHAPPAAQGDPAVRTIKRQFTMLGYNHQMADQKARKLWFKQHPQERSECYPE
jgi:hypothetical protein